MPLTTADNFYGIHLSYQVLAKIARPDTKNVHAIAAYDTILQSGDLHKHSIVTVNSDISWPPFRAWKSALADSLVKYLFKQSI